MGILVFGMVPFGWRIVGTLFGVAMVPVMICSEKRSSMTDFMRFALHFNDV